MQHRSALAVTAAAILAATGLIGAVAAPAASAAASTTGATAAAPGSLVSAVPASTTPNVGDGSGYEVDSILQVGSTVYQGGTFSTVNAPGAKSGGLTQPNLFAADASSGAVRTAFRPAVNGAVDALVAGPVADTVFIGGSFTTVDGVTSKSLALVNATTGALVAGFKAPPMNGIVNSLALSHDRLLLGGTFTTLNGVAHAGLGSVNTSSGAVDAYLGVQLAGHHNYGVNCNPATSTCSNAAVGATKLAVSPDGAQLMVIGNFTSASGLHRDQVARLLLGASSASVDAGWATARYSAACYPWAYDSYVRDIAYSPDGSYFVIVATGGGGQPNPSSSGCDAAARFESASSGSDVQPTWMDYAGNDTLFSVAVTSSAVYVGGHQRWLNNANGSDNAGPGALPRPGIAALDPVNGLPFSWNPGRNPRGARVDVLYATPAGLWVGGDTNYVGNYRYYRAKDSFFPYTGGETLPAAATTSLPSGVYLGGMLPSSANSNVLYRVDAGGPTVQAVDNGPNWIADTSDPSPYRNSGSNGSSWTPSATTSPTVPRTTPLAIFGSERWDPGSKGDGGEMRWQFPVAAGTPIEVRIYLANHCACTSQSGQRLFDVTVDGTTVAYRHDIVATVGNNTGEMLRLDGSAPASGQVTIDFTHEVENPLVNGIEIVKTGSSPAAAADTLQVRSYDGSKAGATTAVPTSAPWSTFRGAFMVDDHLVYGTSDGNLHSAPFDGTTLGTPTSLDPYDDPAWASVQTGSGQTYQGAKSPFYAELPNVTGMTYSNGYVFYTLVGRPQLYYRYFEPESGLTGATEMTAASSADLSNADGLFVSGGRLYWADAPSGHLMSAPFSGPSTPGGTATGAVLSGPAAVADATTDWRARALFLGPTPNQPPTASFTQACTSGHCAFDATGSSDPDGSVASYAWSFGDGTAGTGVSPSHDYSAAGSYAVTLTVTDDRGATGSSTRTVAIPVSSPTAAFTASCSGATCAFDGGASSDSGGSLQGYAWGFGDGTAGTAGTGSTTSHTYPASGSYVVTLTVTDNLGATSTTQQTETVTVPTSAVITFVGSSDANANTTTARVAVPGGTQVGDLLLLFGTVNSSTSTVGGPGPGWTSVGTATTAGIASQAWEKFATGDDVAGSASLTFGGSYLQSDLTMAAYRGVTPTGVRAFAAAVDSGTATHSTPAQSTAPGDWVVSYWADKSSTTTAWTPPSGQSLRSAGYGSGGGRVSSLLTDYGAPVGTSVSSLTATTNAASGKATSWTLDLGAS